MIFHISSLAACLILSQTHIHTHTYTVFLSLNSALLFFHSFLPVKFPQKDITR